MSMKTLFTSLLLLCLGIPSAFGLVLPKNKKKAIHKDKSQLQFIADCTPSVAATTLEINNVRAALGVAGNLWWNGEEGQYIVPKVDPESGQAGVSAIFAGGIWMGGFDPGGNLKLAAQTYGHHNNGNNKDYWAGPIGYDGIADSASCVNWDRFFKVTKTSIDQHRANWEAAKAAGRTQLNPEEIPEDIKGWPALGNPYFLEVHKFSLPSGNPGFSGLANFWDEGGTPGVYEPQYGDFPIVESRGCTNNSRINHPDEIIFWIFNDAGGVHQATNADPINMEIHVHSYAYQTLDQLDDMTFYNYRFINRALENLEDTHIALWVDPELGCYTDDYIGCDTSRNLAYIYNSDDLDGLNNCEDCGVGNTNTYCTDIPVVGIDFFRGPLNEFGEEISMSSFTYYDGSYYLNPVGSPSSPSEHYYYMTGRWTNGDRLAYGGTGFDPLSNNLTNFAFPSPPNSNDPESWSMCSENLSGKNDLKFVQSFGPFTMRPGSINEMTFGVLYTPSMDYPCPDMTRFFQTDDYVQALFDGCFADVASLTPPDIELVELDREIVLLLSNENPQSNNYKETFASFSPTTIGSSEEFLYKFEGYQIFQLSENNPKADLSNPDEARLVAQVDIKNDIAEIHNWQAIENPNRNLPGELKAIWEPTLMVKGTNEGIKHSFKITKDKFTTGDPSLVNHRDYYYAVIAYAHNNWQTFKQYKGLPEGQRTPYLPGYFNIVKATPRPIVHVDAPAKYGDGPIVTRLDGKGVGSNFVEMAPSVIDAILGGTFDGKIEYRPGQAPIDVKVTNPLIIKDNTYTLSFKDADLTDDSLSRHSYWELVNTTTNEIISANHSIDQINEQIVSAQGFSIDIHQTEEPGNFQPGNGALGIEVEYKNPDGPRWFSGIPDQKPPFNWVNTSPGEPDNPLDPNSNFANQLAYGFWQPYPLTNISYAEEEFFLISPSWDYGLGNPRVRLETTTADLNNVDIVLTADKSKWSRCIVLETAARTRSLSSQFRKPTEGDARMFEIRPSKSVGKYDKDGDGLADPDGSDRDGFGWFPGYAIDVETGQRLNILFGENSTYDCAALEAFGLDKYCDQIPTWGGGKGIGRDMMWNPTNDFLINVPSVPNDPIIPKDLYPYIAGGQHFIYVTDRPYDGCDGLYEKIYGSIANQRPTAIAEFIWTCFPVISGEGLLPLGAGETGLIPNDISFKLRVDSPYEVAQGTGENQGHPSYQFSFNGVSPKDLTTADEFAVELDQIGIVPNPYYGYSYYENTSDQGIVKITNLPPICDVAIFSLDGKFVRNFQRNETLVQSKFNPSSNQQFAPALEWDLKNSKGHAVPSGMYLVHVDAKEKGERVLKCFLVARQGSQ